MIKYNNNTINDWNFGDDNIIKVYRNGAVVFYKFDSEQGGYKVCYAVVGDITQYSDREFEDVYDKATEKWYKLNNLNQYEQYGIYGEGRNITYYEGKLTIDDDYEYEWNGSSWVNLGEVTSTYVDPNDPIEFEDSGVKALIESKTSIQDITYAQASGITNMTLNTSTSNIFSGLTNPTFNEYKFFTKLINGGYATPFYRANLVELSLPPAFSSTRFASMAEMRKCKELVVPSGYTVCNGADFLNFGREASVTPTITFLGSVPNGTSSRFLFDELYPITIQVPNDKINAWKTFISNNRSGAENYVVGIDPNDYSYVYDIYGSIEYPKYYDEIAEPLDDLTFSTMEDAQAYAEANCVYDGMHATIGADRYYFDSTDENGWVKILEYYKVEDVTPSGASGWTISGSSTYNPNSSYYDDFDLETTSTSSSYKIAKVTIYGYDHFTYYLRSYHPYSQSYGYVTATNVDEIQTPPSSLSYSSSSAITNTYYWIKSPKSAVNLSNYRRVTYNNLDKTVEHTFYVYFYGRTYSSYVGNATILIPKEQTNENWEQVTFSASSNVASIQKSLYIDNNNSTSGGTQYWYYRWMVGLPSGSHSSYTNYSNYSYCPNVTSSTFTSVAGEQRQVNFTYDNTTDKTLSFRLTDGSNVLTPSDTVYYNMTYYNNCGVSSSSSNVTFPRSQSVKVGGRFRFANSSNRHYIYGYSPNISLNTDYYVDNYQSTFDITYTKLSDEAVTITYTTYDPSDVETPAFKTDITYPYSGGTTSSTTLTSYDVPYTYSYQVSQTSDKFSAEKQSYTANQAARTINFVLYPNNREFATVADMEAYAYAWEGMKAKVGDTNYKYENGEWVENQHSLPDVPFTVNYNAKQYNASTKTLLKTEGQLADVDAVITAGTPRVNDGYLTIASNTRATISGYQNYFNRSNSTPNLTIISKQKTNGSNGHMFANRDSNYNWMYRCYSNKLTLHGTSEQGSVAVTTQPVIESVRVDSNRLLTYNNYTDNTSSTYSSFNYGGTNKTATALFAGYAYSSGEWFVGDFYWVYMCQGTLTDEQVQQVIDYNENL